MSHQSTYTSDDYSTVLSKPYTSMAKLAYRTGGCFNDISETGTGLINTYHHHHRRRILAYKSI